MVTLSLPDASVKVTLSSFTTTSSAFSRKDARRASATVVFSGAVVSAALVSALVSASVSALVSPELVFALVDSDGVVSSFPAVLPPGGQERPEHEARGEHERYEFFHGYLLSFLNGTFISSAFSGKISFWDKERAVVRLVAHDL